MLVGTSFQEVLPLGGSLLHGAPGHLLLSLCAPAPGLSLIRIIARFSSIIIYAFFAFVSSSQIARLDRTKISCFELDEENCV